MKLTQDWLDSFEERFKQCAHEALEDLDIEQMLEIIWLAKLGLICRKADDSHSGELKHWSEND